MTVRRDAPTPTGTAAQAAVAGVAARAGVRGATMIEALLLAVWAAPCLVIIGGLFLWRNLHPDTPIFDLLAQYWPFILIAEIENLRGNDHAVKIFDRFHLNRARAHRPQREGDCQRGDEP